LAEKHHVVVDGSNIATEGRTSPSLAQLDEAVRTYAAEDPDASIIVVVDATFEHRVSDGERDAVRKAMLEGEIVSPPAGAIGRGDAFVLRIAERTGATVLSNDSFQEFHGQHPWLFDEGRLIGGKPVTGVGWIFTPRLPIRGPKSRAATADAKSKKDPESAAVKAAELARAAKKAAKKASKASKKAPQKSASASASWPLVPNSPPPRRRRDPVLTSAIEEAVEEALHPPDPKKARAATKKPATAKRAAPARGQDKHPQRKSEKVDVPAAQQSGKKKKRGQEPPPAVNEPLAFINFVAAFSVGETVMGEVVSFTSHGAMVDVALPAGGALHCYIPLTGMGTPPPNKARQVLKKGEVRSFVLAGLDAPRRVAELALPEASKPVPGASAKRSGPQRQAPPPGKKASKPTKTAKSTKAAEAAKVTKSAKTTVKATKAAKAAKAVKTPAPTKAATVAPARRSAKKAAPAAKAHKASGGATKQVSAAPSRTKKAAKTAKASKA
jgi:hypothetical protein